MCLRSSTVEGDEMGLGFLHIPPLLLLCMNEEEAQRRTKAETDTNKMDAKRSFLIFGERLLSILRLWINLISEPAKLTYKLGRLKIGVKFLRDSQVSWCFLFSSR